MSEQSYLSQEDPPQSPEHSGLTAHEACGNPEKPREVSEHYRELGRQFNQAIMGLRSSRGTLSPLQSGGGHHPLGEDPFGGGSSRQGNAKGPKGRKHRKLQDLDSSYRGMPLVLRYLLEHGGRAYPSQLKEATGLTQARISNTLAALESKGYVERATDGKDRRHVVVTLTQAGSRAVEQRKAAMDAYVGSLLEDLGERDAKEFIRILNKLAGVLEQRSAHACTSDKDQKTTKEDQ